MPGDKLQSPQDVLQAIDRLTAAVLTLAMETMSTNRESEVISDEVTHRVITTYGIALLQV
jgi:hypothetical protein